MRSDFSLNSFMHFHLLLYASIPSHTKHPYKSVLSLNCRYCTVEVVLRRLGSTGRLNRHNAIEDDLLNSPPIPMCFRLINP